MVQYWSNLIYTFVFFLFAQIVDFGDVLWYSAIFFHGILYLNTYYVHGWYWNSRKSQFAFDYRKYEKCSHCISIWAFNWFEFIATLLGRWMLNCAMNIFQCQCQISSVTIIWIRAVNDQSDVARFLKLNRQLKEK